MSVVTTAYQVCGNAGVQLVHCVGRNRGRVEPFRVKGAIAPDAVTAGSGVVNASGGLGLPPSLSALQVGVTVYDPATAEHSARVARISAAVARSLDLSGQEIQTVWWAAVLHDLGNLAVDVALLRKVGPLDKAQSREVRRHPEVGCALLLALSPSLTPIAVAVRAHHERWDGSGYPDGLGGEEIPLVGRIIAIADAFDSMTQRPPYRAEALPASQAIGEVQNQSGSQFDPSLVQLFVELYDTGRLVEVSQILQSVRSVPEPTRTSSLSFPALSRLTKREYEVLVLLLEGERVPSIANTLYVSKSTVRNHLSSIFSKFEVHSQAQLIRLLGHN